MQNKDEQQIDLENQTEHSTMFGLQKKQLINWILFLLLGVTVTALFYLLGNDSEIQITKGSRSIFYWVYFQWGHERYSGNWIILVVAAYIIFNMRKELAKLKSSPSWFGMLVFIGAIMMHIVGYRTQFPRISLIATIPAYWGLVCTIWGWDIAKKLLFPAGYALLCFSASLLQDFTMPLRLYSSALADVLLDGVGIETIRDGTTIRSSAGGGFIFDVEDACSGLRSLTAMMALTAPYAYYTLRGGLWRKWVLFIFSIPLAMVSNALRIFTLAAIAEWIGTDLAMMLYHDLSGYIVLIFSILLLIATTSILQPRKKEEDEDNDEDDEDDSVPTDREPNKSSTSTSEEVSETNKEVK
ncbi:MAG: exosortase/archaeosortase family protein [Kiritimatiellae bacterium]|nr:exosortase/archaeosortase family protein [Kiritimatiellia bacterium]